MQILLNTDVPDLDAAGQLYRHAFKLKARRRFGDAVLELLGAALPRAVDAGLLAESPVRDTRRARIMRLADPFGHRWCLLQFSPPRLRRLA